VIGPLVRGHLHHLQPVPGPPPDQVMQVTDLPVPFRRLPLGELDGH
jgi:hypothetical protein